MALGLLLTGSVAASDIPAPPDVTLQPLFQQIQRAHLFADQKTFADALPRHAPEVILQAWQSQHEQPGFQLDAFVAEHFALPGPPPVYVPAPGQTLREHIEGLWPVLTRQTAEVDPHGSLLPLPNHYVVPGGRFREVYYWD
ncbi:trehalase family glycosidase, partial [Xanthomonas citri pv. citri]